MLKQFSLVLFTLLFLFACDFNQESNVNSDSEDFINENSKNEEIENEMNAYFVDKYDEWSIELSRLFPEASNTIGEIEDGNKGSVIDLAKVVQEIQVIIDEVREFDDEKLSE